MELSLGLGLASKFFGDPPKMSLFPRGVLESLTVPAFPLSQEGLKGFQEESFLKGDIFLPLQRSATDRQHVSCQKPLPVGNKVGRKKVGFG